MDRLPRPHPDGGSGVNRELAALLAALAVIYAIHAGGALVSLVVAGMVLR